jgi:transcriptional regulator with XRE-family HTH domain
MLSIAKKRPSVEDFVHNAGMSSPGKRLRDLRKERKLTQTQVEEATGVPQSTQSELERGESNAPSGLVLTKLSTFYEVEPVWIVTGQGPKHAVASKGDKETELLLYFRSLSSEGRDYLLSRARQMHQDEHRPDQRPNDPNRPSKPPLQ